METEAAELMSCTCGILDLELDFNLVFAIETK